MKIKFYFILFFYFYFLFQPTYLFFSRNDENLFFNLQKKYSWLNNNLFYFINLNSKTYTLPETFICAVIQRESHGKIYAHSKKGARGLMQVMECHKPKHSPAWALYRPILNIALGCRYLDICRQPDMLEQLRKYNQGHNGRRENYRNWQYVYDIMFDFAENERLYAGL